jgi:hypothetical protein
MSQPTNAAPVRTIRILARLSWRMTYAARTSPVRDAGRLRSGCRRVRRQSVCPLPGYFHELRPVDGQGSTRSLADGRSASGAAAVAEASATARARMKMAASEGALVSLKTGRGASGWLPPSKLPLANATLFPRGWSEARRPKVRSALFCFDTPGQSTAPVAS